MSGAVRSLVPSRYVDGRWTPCDAPLPCDEEPARASALTVITWNTWFSPFCFEARFRALLAEARAHDPDIVCLQEIIPESLAILLAEPWVQSAYRVSDATGDTLDEYGVVMLSRVPLRGLALHDLPSAMGRRLLVADALLAKRTLSVATVHLESLRWNEDARADQLAQILPALRARGADTVLVGDFNMCASWDENARIDPDFIDLWPALRPKEIGYTQDSAQNPMLRAMKGKASQDSQQKQVRFDRILLRSQEWRAEFIQRLGTFGIDARSPDVFPSDHFGLVARIRARDAK